jgi:hypothetical protein
MLSETVPVMIPAWESIYIHDQMLAGRRALNMTIVTTTFGIAILTLASRLTPRTQHR